MTLRALTPNLTVEDVGAAVAYYRDVLGFRFTLGVAEGTQDVVFEDAGRPLGFAMLQRDEVEIMLQSHASVAADLPAWSPAAGAPSVMLYVDVDDVDALHEELAGRGAEVAVPLRDTFYGAREFGVRDPNGLLWVFARRQERG